MASLSQPRGLNIVKPFHSPDNHSWTDPGHYFRCKFCRDFRYTELRRAEYQANKAGRLCAIGVGHNYQHSRVLQFRCRQAGTGPKKTRTSEKRRVTIQVPDLVRPVRPAEPLTVGEKGRKRSFAYTDQIDPPVYLVPDNFNSQAGADSWAAKSLYTRSESENPTSVEPAPTHAVTGYEFPMPGMWPSWAEKPNPLPPHSYAHHPTLAPEPVRDFQSITLGFFWALSHWSVSTLHALQNRLWRPVATSVAPVTATTSAIDNDGLQSFKRRRLSGESSDRNNGPTQGYGSLMRSKRSQSTRSNRPGRILNSMRTSRSQSYSAPSSHVNKSDPNFNYAGHFSVDMAYLSDSDDNEDAGDPMVIDTPDPPFALPGNEAIFASQSIESQNAASKVKLESASARPSILTNAEPKPKLNSAVAAARRAVRLFPKDSTVPRARVSPSSHAQDSAEVPLPEDSPLVSPTVERLRHKETEVLAAADTLSPQKTEKTRYGNVLEFFPNDVVHSLPGLGDDGLAVDLVKAEYLKRTLMERLRQEEIDVQNAALKRLGLRRPKSALISNTSPHWVNKAWHAPQNGKFNPQGVHSDAVELQPRDFAKLVPETAWLNDDCVHSTLCCLAAYVNKKAGVRFKADAPKCVAISSLYWTAFCGDYKKLYPRPFSRKWGMTPENFLNIDTVLIPVNWGAHWTLIAIRPSRRTISYLDSFHKSNEAQLRHAYKWLELFLGNKFVASEWKTQEVSVPRQTNAWDCGVFVITNAMCLALGINPMCYTEGNMPAQRLRIAAMLLNGGFHGEFDLSHL
ncbi:hypothetical protein GGS21DRAFT_493162 [Xylaria nigripes]|nr:hypothetical protein GGS21DRAFT_493162 [Xylaria nigripes]